MKSFRTQVTLLLLVAMMLISLLSVIASVVIQNNFEGPEIRYVYGVSKTVVDSANQQMENAASVGVDQSLLFLAYAVLIAVCAGFVSIVVGDMVVRPLKTLELAIESVNPQAIIPKMVESGDGANLITVKLLNRLSETLKDTLNSRMRLVAAAGHDLRTPLTRMRLRAEMIDDEKEREKWIKDVDEMVHIADSAITLVKEEVVSREYEAMRVDVLVEGLVAELALIGRNVKVDKIEPIEVEGSPVAIKRALSNLMVNACTHGVNASVSIIRDYDNCIIGIKDEGPGIPEEVIQNAFEPFFQVSPARKRSTPGAGLGLAIVKEIVMRHKGSITLVNRHPNGLYQEVVFPLIDDKAAALDTECVKIEEGVFDIPAFNQGVKDALSFKYLRDLF